MASVSLLPGLLASLGALQHPHIPVQQLRWATIDWRELTDFVCPACPETIAQYGSTRRGQVKDPLQEPQQPASLSVAVWWLRNKKLLLTKVTIDDFTDGHSCRFRSPSRCTELDSYISPFSVVAGVTKSANAVLLLEGRFSSERSLDTAPAHFLQDNNILYKSIR